jgi:protoporphyrin/coproporphyrin ferrochelatase
VIDGVLLLAHGAPESLAGLEAFVTHIREGRPPSAALLADLRQRYEAIGGHSPLTEITVAQARALGQALGGRWPVLVGMRHAPPFLAGALTQAAGDGLRALLAVPLTPQHSALGTGRYRQAVESATPAGMRVRFVEAWHEQPRLLEAFAERVRDALATGPRDAVVFTAHSLPLRGLRDDEHYPRQVQATAAGVAARVGLTEVRVAYQSAAQTGETWLGPTLEATLVELAQSGRRRVLVVPVGFVADHTEILYDIDVAAKAVAGRLGLDLARSESLNTSPTFIRALAELVDQHE